MLVLFKMKREAKHPPGLAAGGVKHWDARGGKFLSLPGKNMIFLFYMEHLYSI